MIEILEQRDVLMQLLAFVFVVIGTFTLYVVWKGYGTKTKITLMGVVKKLLIAVAAWVALLIEFQALTWWDWNTVSHIVVIIVAFKQGLIAEYVGGALIQQSIEKTINKRKVVEAPKAEEAKKDVADPKSPVLPETEKTDGASDKK